jgi:glycosyltransferase involved in cell wall biosynthesis
MENVEPSSSGPEVRPLQGKRAAVLLYSYYPSDSRPRREAESLVAAGYEVDLICLQESESEPKRELINGVNVKRLPLSKRRESKLAYSRQYLSFLMACAALLAFWSLKKRYRIVHVHNMPDFLVFGAVVPKMLGAKVVLDLHDPMPELMMSIYDLPEHHRYVTCLKSLEKWSIAFVDLVLTPNIAFRNLFISRGCPAEKIGIVMNSPQMEIFDPAKYAASGQDVSKGERPFRLMYHGLIAERHGLDTAIEALAQIRSQIPSLEFHIYGGRTSYLEKIEQMVEHLHLRDCVDYCGFKPQSIIAEAIAGADLGVIPNRRCPFTEINMPTRIFEYLAMGKPVIAPNTQGIRDYFDAQSLLLFEPGNSSDLAEKILWVFRNRDQAADLAERGRRVYHEHLWIKEDGRLTRLMEKLTAA